MKIVCMIGTPPYLHYFVNAISKHHEIALVVREDGMAGGGLCKKIRDKGFINSAGLVINRVRNKKKQEADYNAVFGNEWQQLSDKVPVYNTPDINSDKVRQQLQEIKPDLILVHGTSLIKNKTIAGMPLVLNLHWGLSPYYKGSYCTEWALINNDPLNIGFTIHRITAKIDAGDVLTQERIVVDAFDTLRRINMRLTKTGTQAMVKVISRLKENESPVFKTQDYSKGNLYLVKHWTKNQAKQIAQIENTTAINLMLSKPSAPALPIVTW